MTSITFTVLLSDIFGAILIPLLRLSAAPCFNSAVVNSDPCQTSKMKFFAEIVND